jgi:ABC-type xylose transport system permease subunit
MGAMTILIIACMFLPFLPGGYDGFTVTLSGMSQLFGVAGLLLVPIGTLWLIYESRKRAPKNRERSNKDKGYYFAMASVVASSILAIMASHDGDILLWTPQDLYARRGYYAVHHASSPHWKYFWFD